LSLIVLGLDDFTQVRWGPEIPIKNFLCESTSYDQRSQWKSFNVSILSGSPRSMLGHHVFILALL